MKFFKKSDILIILILIVLSVSGLLIYRHINSGKSAIAEIYYKTTLVKTIDLSNCKDEEFSIPQNENVVFRTYSDGSICFYESDCPDKICIHAGRLSMPGESAACLPNQIFLKIVSKDNKSDDMDMVAGQ